MSEAELEDRLAELEEAMSVQMELNAEILDRFRQIEHLLRAVSR